MVSKLLMESWSFFTVHLLAFVIIIFPFVIPTEIFVSLYYSLVLTEDAGFLQNTIPGIAYVLVYPVYSIAVIYYISAAANGEKVSITAMWRLGVRYWLPYVVLMLLLGILCGLGALLLIIPGIYLALKFSFAPFELLLKGKKPFASLESSWEFTKGHVGKILGGSFILFGSFFLLQWLIGSNFNLDSLAYQVFYIASNILASLLGALYVVFLFRVYWFAGGQAAQSPGSAADGPGSTGGTQ